ncbi:MAG: glycerol-3-phosphate dehydrogenase [Chloroflexota bacterium]|nr:glycerol-3-phosphate dehydrogenase [Chloroflexota bacterium]
MTTAAIVGAGVMGTATAWPLSDNGHEVRLVGTHLDRDIIQSCKDRNYHPRLKRDLPPNVTPFFLEEIETALQGVDFILSGVNSLGAHWIGQTLAPFLKPGDTVIAVTKGLEAGPDGELLILPEVLRAELPAGLRDQVSLAAIGGPCIAGELAGRRHSCVFFGSRELETARRLADIYRTDYYHVQPTDQMTALEIAVALKNAYALGVGLAGGMLQAAGGADAAGAVMHNPAAALFAQGTTEIHRVLEMLDVDPSFAYSLPGAGDLFVTARGGRSVTLGQLLGEGKDIAEAREILKGETLEAALVIEQMALALPRLETRGLLRPQDMPLMHALVDVVVHARPLKLDFDAMFSRIG